MRIHKDFIDGSRFASRSHPELPWVLVTPRENYTIWKKEELILRSSIWKIDGDFLELISTGYPKFFNLGEQTDVVDIDPSAPFEAVEKEDGSLLIVSFSGEGELICVRTRGTWDAFDPSLGFVGLQSVRDMIDANIDFMREFSSESKSGTSFLFEWNSTENRIVIKHDADHFILTGIIDHHEFVDHPTEYVSEMVTNYMSGPVYAVHNVASYKNLKALIEYARAFDDREGIVIRQGDNRFKVKSEWYIEEHSARQSVGNKPQFVFKVWAECDKIDLDTTTEESLFEMMEEAFDYEVATAMAESYPVIIDTINQFNAEVVEPANVRFRSCRHLLPDMKEFALSVDLSKPTHAIRSVIFALAAKSQSFKNIYISWTRSNKLLKNK